MIDTNIFFYNQVYIIFMGLVTYVFTIMKRLTIFLNESKDSLFFPKYESTPKKPSISTYKKIISKTTSSNSITILHHNHDCTGQVFDNIPDWTGQVFDNIPDWTGQVFANIPDWTGPAFGTQPLEEFADIESGNFYKNHKNTNICFVCNIDILLNISIPTYHAYDNIICKKCYFIL